MKTNFSRFFFAPQVNAICIDESGEYVASCSNDGKVVISSMYSDDDKFAASRNYPVYGVALEPGFKRSKEKKFAEGGVDARLVMSEKGTWCVQIVCHKLGGLGP